MLDDRVLTYADCAVNPDLNVEKLAQITIDSTRTSATFGMNLEWLCSLTQVAILEWEKM